MLKFISLDIEPTEQDEFGNCVDFNNDLIQFKNCQFNIILNKFDAITLKDFLKRFIDKKDNGQKVDLSILKGFFNE